MKENDLLKFVCADKDISSKPNAHSSTLHEVAYLLDYTKEQEYENCDARSELKRKTSLCTKEIIFIIRRYSFQLT